MATKPMRAAARASTRSRSCGTVRILRQAVPLRVVAVREHGDHAGAADARRVVERRRCAKPFALSCSTRALRRAASMSSFVAELQAAGRAGLDARGLEPDRHAVDAERALGHLAGRLREARHVERAAGLAVAAADARAPGSRRRCRSAYCTIAPGAGQAARQPGSSQCMHWSLRISHASPPSESRSLELDQVPVVRRRASASSGSVPTCSVGATGRSFHSWQATSHALQPMHVRRVDVLRHRRHARACRLPAAAERGGRAADLERLAACHCATSLRLLELHQEGLVLRASRCSGPSPTA